MSVLKHCVFYLITTHYDAVEWVRLQVERPRAALLTATGVPSISLQLNFSTGGVLQAEAAVMGYFSKDSVFLGRLFGKCLA